MNEERSMEFFENAFASGTSGCYRECSCGIIHFDVSDNGWTWEKDELEDLIEHSKREPFKYIKRDGAVSTLIIKNDEYVIGCICKSIEKTKIFIDGDSKKILNYLYKSIQEKIRETENFNDGLKRELRYTKDLMSTEESTEKDV